MRIGKLWYEIARNTAIVVTRHTWSYQFTSLTPQCRGCIAYDGNSINITILACDSQRSVCRRKSLADTRAGYDVLIFGGATLKGTGYIAILALGRSYNQILHYQTQL
jgi:hypothetical protein